MKRTLVGILVAISVACSGNRSPITIPDITIVLPTKPPMNNTPPTPVEPPPPVVAVPPTEPEQPPTPEEQPFHNLNIRVFDVDTKAPIVGALVENITIKESRQTDGSGFANFGVQGATTIRVSATDYASDEVSRSPGDVEVLLKSTKPKPVEPPKPTGPLACGRQLNSGFISFECLDAVARVSQEWPLCAKGNAEACSLYTWEVARALNDAQKETRWGLISKRSGSNFRGYGEDVVAYLPSQFSIDDKEVWQWNGADIIGGLGGPAPTRNPGKLHGAIACGTPEAEAERWCNRSDNFWVPVPPK